MPDDARTQRVRRRQIKSRDLRATMQADRIEDYLRRLTPLARGSLLTELESTGRKIAADR